MSSRCQSSEVRSMSITLSHTDMLPANAAIVLGILLWYFVPRCRRKLKERKANKPYMSQRYERLEESGGVTANAPIGQVSGCPATHRVLPDAPSSTTQMHRTIHHRSPPDTLLQNSATNTSRHRHRYLEPSQRLRYSFLLPPCLWLHSLLELHCRRTGR